MIDEAGTAAIDGLQRRQRCPAIQFAIDLQVWFCLGESQKSLVERCRPDPIPHRDGVCGVAEREFHGVDCDFLDGEGGVHSAVVQGDVDGACAVLRVVHDVFDASLVSVGDGCHRGVEPEAAGCALGDVLVFGATLRVPKDLFGEVKAVFDCFRWTPRYREG